MTKKGKRCVICGIENSCGRMVMDQYVCLDCQQLLDDPNRRVFGCKLNRKFHSEELQLAKAKK